MDTHTNKEMCSSTGDMMYVLCEFYESMNFPIRYFMSQHATECNTRMYSEIVEFNKRVDHPSNRSFPLTPFPFTFSSNNPCIFIINPVSSTISNKRFFWFIMHEFTNIERDLIWTNGVTSIWYKLNYDSSLVLMWYLPKGVILPYSF